MTMLLVEGFEWLASGTSEANVETYLSKFWQYVNVSSNGLVTTRGTYIGAELSSSSTHQLVTRKLQQPDGDTTCIFGFYYKSPTTWFNGGDLWRIVGGDTSQCLFDINTGGTINFKRGFTTLGTSTYALANSNEYYIEIKIVIADGTSGSMEMKIADLTAAGDDDIDTATEWTVSGVDTRNSSAATETAWDQIQFLHAGLSGTTVYDDIYICNGAGSNNNDFLNNTYIETLEPDGAGNSTQLTPSTGSNWQNVDDPTNPDDDSTYNTADADAETDLYTTSNPSRTGNLNAIAIQALVRCTSADPRTIRIPFRNDSVTSEGSDYVILADTYQGRTRMAEQDSGATDWTKAKADGLEIGIKRQS